MSITFQDLKLQTKIKETNFKFKDNEITVRNYLPIHEKVEFIQFVVANSLDEITGCFSPVRTEIYYGIGLCRYYAGIEFSVEDIKNIESTFDALDSTGLIGEIENWIPEEESNFIRGLIDETIQDIARYNSSAAGIINAMSANSTELNETITSTLDAIKNKEGLELLDQIKNVVGND